MSAIRRILTAVVCMFVLASCQEDGNSATATDSVFPDLLSIQRTDCEKRGGRWGAAPGKAAQVCYRTLPDANQSCQVESDCAGLCLARSRTCSPVEPFYGCHEVLSASGLRQTVCIE